jgi:hypothetical protein
MTTSPAFLREIADQVRLAREQMTAALARGDDSDAVVAQNRIADLDDLAGRVADSSLIAAPSLP